MDISIFLAKALGLYLVIISISMLINASMFTTILNDMTDDPSLLLFSGVLVLIFGILLVLTHNIWQFDWRIIITVLAWMSLIKGIVRVLFPQLSFGLIRYFARRTTAYYLSGLIMLFIGFFLCYFGFK